MGNVPSLVRDIRYFMDQVNSSQTSNAHPELSLFLTGNIPESTLLSCLIAAVTANRVTALRFLLLRGASVNAKDNEGNCLLHIAIVNNSVSSFKFLIKKPEIDVDGTNVNQASALFAAVVFNRVYFVKKLIKKGADVNRRDKMGCIPLHYACQHSLPEICELLIQSGSLINVQNIQGNTPLYQASQYRKTDIIYMLLYYGADASIPSDYGVLPVMMDLDYEVRWTLYHHTFDSGDCTMDLKILTRAMIRHWRVFPKILDIVSNVTYNVKDLRNLNDAIIAIQVEHLKLFWEKFDYVFRDMLHQCCTLTNYLTSVESMKRASPDFLTILYTLLESPFVTDVVQSSCVSVSVISSLVNIFQKNNFSLEKLTEVVVCFLSYGVPLTSADLNAVYVFYGRCELFEILLHMDIETPKNYVPCCTLYDHEVIQQSIMPYFIYDVSLDIDTFLENSRSYLLMDLDVMLFYFARPQLKEFFLADGASDKLVTKVNKLPSVPYLVELARDAARSYIIRRLEIKSCSQFYTVLKQLPINNVYKKILSFEKKLYCD